MAIAVPGDVDAIEIAKESSEAAINLEHEVIEEKAAEYEDEERKTHPIDGSKLPKVATSGSLADGATLK